MCRFGIRFGEQLGGLRLTELKSSLQVCGASVVATHVSGLDRVTAAPLK